MKLVRLGKQVDGTLHLTPHHIIFSYVPPAPPGNAATQGVLPQPQRPKELWITYPIIQTCNLRLSPSASHMPSSIRLRCRDFTFACFCFTEEKKARDVFESIKAWTCKIGRVDKLYAFSYTPQQPERDIDGWSLYDARQEYKRLGIGEKHTDKGWRISRINEDYAVRMHPKQTSFC